MSIFEFFPPSLGTDQREALRLLEVFLQPHSPQQCFRLTGYAGTGKTFLLKGLTAYIDHLKRNAVMMAPTGRAAMVMRAKMNRDAYTVHKTIYNFDDLYQDERTFKFYFKLRGNNDSDATIYILDEASMVSDKYADDEFFMFGSGLLLTDLIKYIGFPQRSQSKLLIIGDDAQLPPVNMPFSPALNMDYLRQLFPGEEIQFAQMREVFRQKEKSFILEAATSLREQITADKFTTIQIPGPNEEINDLARQDFLPAYIKISHNSTDSDTIIISHSNKKALEYNVQVRTHFFPTAEIEKGDKLIIVKNNYNYIVPVYNGMFAKVIETADIPEPKTIVFKVKGGKTEKAELVFRDVVLEIVNEQNESVTLRCKILDHFLLSEYGRISSLEQRALYIEFKDRMAAAGIKPKTDAFNQAIKNDPYFNAIQAKYGYAITCHKAQGGEWANVIVDFNASMGRLSKGFFRWAYTAITRSSHRLYVIDAPRITAATEFVIKKTKMITQALPEAFHIPTVPAEAGDPTVFTKYPFLKARHLAILQECEEREIAASLSTPNYALRYRFRKNHLSAEADISYSARGFNGYINLFRNNNADFAEEILAFLKERVIYPYPYTPGSTQQQEMYEYITERAEDMGITITNLIYNNHCDRYFLITDTEGSMLDCWYNQSGIYTYIQPSSLSGDEDQILNSFIQSL